MNSKRNSRRSQDFEQAKLAWDKDTRQTTLKKRIKTPATIKRPLIRKAEIMDLVIGTHASGGWYWEVTVKNTGTSTINGKDLTVQGEKKSFPPAQNSWTAASGSIVSLTNIAPNQTVKVKRNWSRCCKTEELGVKLRDKTNNSVMDTKTLTHLLFDCVGRRPFNVKVKRVEWIQQHYIAQQYNIYSLV